MTHPLPWRAEKLWRHYGDMPCLCWAVVDAAGREVFHRPINADNPDRELESLARFIANGANAVRPTPERSLPLEMLPQGQIEAVLGVLFRTVGECMAAAGVASPQFALVVLGADGRAYYTAQANRAAAVNGLRAVASEMESIPEVPR